jgi:hypothetical protein
VGIQAQETLFLSPYFIAERIPTAVVQSGKPLVIVAVDVQGESLVWAATFFLSANS